MFIFNLQFLVLASTWNVQWSKATCWDFLGSDQAGDHIQYQFTNPDVFKTIIHGTIGIPQELCYPFYGRRRFAPRPVCAVKHWIIKGKFTSLPYPFWKKHLHIEMYPEKKCIFKVNNRITRNTCTICSKLIKDTRKSSTIC